jgi:predicted NUDIX family NTP pyrophosphohydrolase
MEKKKSAGILLYRLKNKALEVLLVHHGGPFWAKKDLASWSIPKGEFTEEENPLEAAKREFQEETGLDLTGDFIELTPIKQKSGKLVYGWAVAGDIDPAQIKSNTFEMEWPPKSGKRQSFPEIDKGEWFSVPESKLKILEPQTALIDELISILKLTPEQTISLNSNVKPKDDSAKPTQIDLF